MRGHALAAVERKIRLWILQQEHTRQQEGQQARMGSPRATRRPRASLLVELVRWGAPLMAQPVGDAAFRSRWLELPVKLLLTDQTPNRPPIAIELRTGEEPMTIETIAGDVRARPGTTEDPDLVLSGAPELVVGVLAGQLQLSDACAHGLQSEGDPRALARVQSHADASDTRLDV